MKLLHQPILNTQSCNKGLLVVQDQFPGQYIKKAGYEQLLRAFFHVLGSKKKNSEDTIASAIVLHKLKIKDFFSKIFFGIQLVF